MPAVVVVRVAEPLRFLLRPRERVVGGRALGFDPDATVGHLVQAAGVPLTEVGGLVLDGRPVAPEVRAGPGSLVEVSPVVRPERIPHGGLLLDVGLGALARRLRLLGLDCAWSGAADDPGDAGLVRRAREEDRVLLTQDRRLLMRRALPRGALVRGNSPDDQLADVLDRFTPQLAPLTRCTACGGVLAPAAKAEVADRLAPGTRRTYDEFSRCRSCGRIYWRGAHARRIDELVRSAGARARHGGSGRATLAAQPNIRQGSASALRVRDTADPRT